MALEIGAIVEGEITSITNFGAFVQLPEGKVGLVHISEVSNAYVKDIHDFLKEHDKVKVKLLAIDARGKLALSIKQAEPPAPPKPARPQAENRERRGGNRPQGVNKPSAPMSFDDKLSKFLKESEDRMLDFKRNTESKRGGRGGRRGK